MTDQQVTYGACRCGVAVIDGKCSRCQAPPERCGCFITDANHNPYPGQPVTMPSVQSPLPPCAHGGDERTCFRCRAEGPSVPLPSDWKREGMVVVADSMTGKLLGCMGRNTWEEMDRG